MESKQELFDFFAQEHGLTLSDSQMHDIVHKVFKHFSLCHSCGDIIHEGGQVQCAACERETYRRIAELTNTTIN